MDEKYLKTKAAARQLGVSSKTLELWRMRDEGPNYFKVGGRYYYTKKDLLKFIALCRKEVNRG